MNPLQRALIEKNGHDNGFECVLTSELDTVVLASATHTASARVIILDGYQVFFESNLPSFFSELARGLVEFKDPSFCFRAKNESELASLLRRAAGLSRALPNQAEVMYEHEVEEELASLPAALMGTEVERVIRQRVGQQKFRDAMLDYWGGRCAVTGITISAVLRASHAKPWAECVSDTERLDVFNGFLLSANMDALFDKFLISFDEQGNILISNILSDIDRSHIGLSMDMKLRWIAPQHQDYLDYHRACFYS